MFLKHQNTYKSETQDTQKNTANTLMLEIVT